MSKKVKSFIINAALVATAAIADDTGNLTKKVLEEKPVSEILAIYNANAKSTGDAERKSFKDRDTAVKVTWEYLTSLFGELVQDTAPTTPAPKEAKSAAVAAVSGEGKPSKPKKEKKERVAVERKPRGTDRPYKVLATENPFSEGTIRHGLFVIISKHGTTSAARAEDKKISTPFMEELASRGVIEFTDGNGPVAKPKDEPAPATEPAAEQQNAA